MNAAVCTQCDMPAYAYGCCLKHYCQIPEVKARRSANHARYTASEKGKQQRAKSRVARDGTESGVQKAKRRSKAWRESEKGRLAAIKYLYGLTAEAYTAMLQQQGGACAICRMPSKRRLAVDHCHTTGRVRGLLCHGCNLILGHAKDSAGVLQQAAAYLLRHREST